MTLHFSAWQILLVGALYLLPLTTIVLVALGIASLRQRRQAAAATRWLIKVGFTVVAPIWFIGAVFALTMSVDAMFDSMHEAKRHFTITASRTIDGIDLPPGTRVNLDGYDRLADITLPYGTTLALSGGTWRGTVEFTHATGSDRTNPTHIRAAGLAADAVLDSLPCRGGQAVSFWGPGGIRTCTLAVTTTMRADMSPDTPPVLCAADQPLELQPTREQQVAVCTLAAAVTLQGIPCAADAEVEIVNARLIRCTLAAHRIFGELQLPAGAALRLADTPRRLERFSVPAVGTRFQAFGLAIPQGAEVLLCQDAWAVDQIQVAADSFVEIGGAKLTGFINFQCGEFQSGTLFEDTQLNGELWHQGQTVFRKNLDLAVP